MLAKNCELITFEKQLVKTFSKHFVNVASNLK